DAELLLARTWGRHLGIDADQVAVDRSFFALGGDSLSAVSIIEELIGYGYDVSTSDLISARTIQKLASTMGEPSATREAEAPPELFSLVSKSDRDALAIDFGDALVDAFPTSALQMAMMFHMRTSGTRQDYHNVTAFEVGSRMVAQRLVDAIDGATSRFDALRTSFDLASYADPLQLIWRNVAPSVAVHDAVALGRPESDIVDDVMASEGQASFDPIAPPLLRWNIVLGEDRTTVLVTEFHPILDGWSLHTVLRNVFDRYAASATGGSHPLEQAEPAAYGMAAHVRREQQVRNAPEVARYWSERVGSMPDTKVGPSQPDLDRRTIGTTIPIPDETWQAVIKVARALDARPSSVFLAVHLSVLSARTGQPVVTSGVVNHTRPDLPGAVNAVGLFLNSLPVSGDVRYSWADIVADVDAQITSNWDARVLPLVDVKSIAGWSDLPFDATFNFVDFRVLHDYVDDETGLELQGGPHSEPSNFAYQLLITAPRLRIGADDRLASVTLEVHAPPFEQRTSDELVALYMAGLAGLVDDPTTSPADAARFGNSELATVLARNGVDDPSLANQTIVETIMHNLEHRGTALAVIDGDLEATYDELATMVAAARQRLVDNGCQPGDIVGLRSGPEIGAIVSIIAIWTCRAAFVVLDPGWPTNRVKQIVDDCRPRLVLCAADEMPDDDDLLAAAPHHSFDLALLGGVPVEAAQVNPPTGDDLAYLMYTSGSTGRPKGVLVPHRGLANYMLWSLDAYGYAAAQRTPVQSAISADLIFPSLFGPLVAGTTVDVLRHRFGGVLGLAENLNNGAVYSMIKATPSQLEVIHAAAAAGARFDIATVVVGAEACTLATAEKIRSMVGDETPVLNEYGPTETVVGCSTYRLRDAASERSVLPLGVPIANMAMYVLDEQHRPMRPGAPGELVIGGEGVAWGYLNQPRVTAARFVPNPFAAEPGMRMYCSGDLAAYSSDTERNIEFLGRIDGQLKIHGYRVEPSEVEAILRDAPGVDDACVHPASNGSLTAHLAEAPDTTIDIAVVDSFAAEWLPRYMVPSRYSIADQIPLTPAGKVDYGALGERRLHRPGGPHRDLAAD
ncbi:amino acid adenylation domain-containing protein, partial [Qipengyuania citrea]|uniref:amino acid adenylation domain-containing protein n=1 Tax=Qipengyuania citrea TaxID=225971 RepID=UPI00329A7C66